MNDPVEALCSLLRCAPEEVKHEKDGRYVARGRLYFLVGPGTPAGVPAINEIVLISEKLGYKIYGLQ